MSQNDFTLANQGFPSMRADMNSAYQALASNNSGATAPTTTYANQWWYDTTTDKLKIRNAGNTAWEVLITNVFSTLQVDSITSESGADAPTFPNGAIFGDNDKAIFGAGSDLQIYHDGSSNRSYITESNTDSNGHLFIQGDNVILENTAGENYFRAVNGGASQIYYSGSEKLATTSTGIDVTGTVAATAFAGDGSGLTGIAGIPSGAVIYHAANTAPTGFIKANGASISTSTYSDLFAVIGYTFGGSGGSFNVPDLRGEFLRGWDDGRGVDSGRGFGSTQSGQMQSHNHGLRGGSGGAVQVLFNQTSVIAGIQNLGGYFSNSTATIQNTGGTSNSSENRPRNIALLACIKY